MAVTAATINQRVEAADAAAGAGDFAGARLLLVRTRMLIIGMPNVVGQDAASVQYRTEDIDALLDALSDFEAAAAVTSGGNKSPLKMFLTRPARPGSARGAEGIV